MPLTSGRSCSSPRSSPLKVKRQHLPGNGQDNRGNQSAADRAVDEDVETAAAQQHGAAEVLLQHRTQDETQHEGGRVELEAQEHITHDAEDGGDEDVIEVVVDTVGADAAENRMDGNSTRKVILKTESQ